MGIIRFIAAFVIYTVIDVGWNLSPLARGMYESLYEASGNDAMFSAYGKQPDTWGRRGIRGPAGLSPAYSPGQQPPGN